MYRLDVYLYTSKCVDLQKGGIMHTKKYSLRCPSCGALHMRETIPELKDLKCMSKFECEYVDFSEIKVKDISVHIKKTSRF